MKTIRNLVNALCTSVALGCIFSCKETLQQEQYTVLDLSTDSISTSISGWVFKNGVCEIQMVVGNSRKLPSTGTGDKTCSWVSSDTTVAIIVKEKLDQKLEAVGVGTTTVTDKNSNLKIYVTVKENN